MAWQQWPVYSKACQRDMAQLLSQGGRLTAYQANPNMGMGPAEGSWAWRAERLAEEIHRVPHVILCQSGTQALEILVRVCGPFGQLVVSPLTFSATVSAVIHAGSTPAFGDVRSADGLLMPGAWRLAVDLFGKQDTYPAIMADSCQAVGLAPMAQHGVWSFNGRKNVPAGEGGAIYTRNEAVAQQCCAFLNHAENFHYATYGWNGHVNEQTALLIYHGLKDVVKRNARRTELATHLNERVKGHPKLVTPDLDYHALYVYPLILPYGNTCEVSAALRRLGWDSQPGYLTPTLEEYPAFQPLRRLTSLHNAHALSRKQLLILPQVTPTATIREMNQLADAVLRAVE